MAEVGVAELPEMARARGLTGTAQVLESMSSAVGEMDPIDAPLLGAASRDPSVNLDELARRGLDPAAAAYLTFLDGRLERGLLAWDLLTDSLRPIADEDGTTRLREEAEAVAAALPAPGARCVQQTSAELARLATAGSSSDSFADIRAAATRGELSAVLELYGRGGEARALIQSAAFRASFVELARRLDAAHLSTVASAYWRFATELLGDRQAAPLMLDTFLDGGADIQGDFDPPVAVYRDYRRAMTREDSAAAIAALRVARPLRDSPHARIVCIDMEALTEPAPALVQAKQLAESFPQWRFAARVVVRATLLAAGSPLSALDDYLARFGNDHRVWLDIVSRAPADAAWAMDVRSRALREVYALPHDPNAWRALGQVVGEPLATVLDEEVTHRLSVQSTITR